MSVKSKEKKFVEALKSAARNESIKEYVERSPELYNLFFRAAQRFIAGEKRGEAITKALKLSSKEYSISIEYIGENTRSLEECIQAKEEFIQLMEEMGERNCLGTVSLDLSHIGLVVEEKLAYHHLMELAEKAKEKGLYLMISMEESAKTDAILNVYKKAVSKFDNIGITLQAQLKRSMKDLEKLVHYPGRIRLVKGAYQETMDISIPRSEDLNQRYIDMISCCIENNHAASIATHDEKVLLQIKEKGFFDHPFIECEMLYGIRPELLREIKKEGYPARVYLTYGSEWYLYLCHRLAENPSNIYEAISDMFEPSVEEKSDY